MSSEYSARKMELGSMSRLQVQAVFAKAFPQRKLTSGTKGGQVISKKAMIDQIMGKEFSSEHSRTHVDSSTAQTLAELPGDGATPLQWARAMLKAKGYQRIYTYMDSGAGNTFIEMYFLHEDRVSLLVDGDDFIAIDHKFNEDASRRFLMRL